MRCHIEATAFGSLWFSSHRGTSSMGKLLARQGFPDVLIDL
ncbi:MAG: hypothetical protein WB764_01910 [Xanthobacteraceae bacterium]